MKKFPRIITSLLVIHTFLFSTQVPAQTSVTFNVCSVPKATELHQTVPYRKAQEAAVGLEGRNVGAWRIYVEKDSSIKQEDKWSLMNDNRFPKRIIIEAAAKGSGELVNTYSANAVAAAMVTAYAEHRPLVLSPDMIWLLILQGFASHIEADPEKMRPYFVDFQGPKTLEVVRAWTKGNPDNPWENVFDEFGKKIAKETKGDLAANCLPQFTTTGPIEKAAFDISLMRAMDPFFDYRFMLMCGIPEITLEGAPADWELLEQHAASLAQYDLAWWIDPLKPVLHEFTQASKGQVDADFWAKMVKKRFYPAGCTQDPFLSGWMLNFFPYIKEKPNPWITHPDSSQHFETAFAAYEIKADERKAEWKKIQQNIEKKGKKGKKAKEQREQLYSLPRIIAPEPESFGLKTLDVSDLPGSLGKADVILNDNGTMYNMEFLAGFIGIRQNPQTFALRPEISWIILDTGLKDGQTSAEYYAGAAKELLKKRN
ncbi:MAG: DUF4419 domain-containing protein [Bacteroidota bacterium]